MSVPALDFDNVSKVYEAGDGRSLHALRTTTFAVATGARIAIVGRSGSGKSTLLHLASGIDIPSGGEVSVFGTSLSPLAERDRTLLRRDTIGLVFQFFHLLPHLTVEENVALPELIAGRESRSCQNRVHDLLQRVELADRADDSVQTLSGGEMQRVAICRALVRRPQLLLADEPTGNLDDANSRIVMDLMLELAEHEGATLLYATHSPEVAARADQTWQLHSGTLEIP